MAPSARRRLSSDLVRGYVAIVIAAVLSAVPAVWAVRSGLIEPERLPWLSILLVWVVFALVYCVLTLVAFVRLEAGPFVAEVLRFPRGARRRERLMLGGGTASWAVQFAVVALGVGVVLAVNEQVSGEPLLLAAGVSVVVVSWVTVLVAYALHYARLTLAPGAESGHHGDDAPVAVEPDASPADAAAVAGPAAGPAVAARTFVDYLAMAASVMTLVGAKDEEIGTPALRRAVAGHSVVAFAFNTVIVSLLVAIVVGA